MLSTFVRPFAPPDLDPVVACWFDTWHAAFAPRRHPRPLEAWRSRFVEEYAGQAEIWLTLASGDVVAFMVLFPQTGWLEQLFVVPKFQGRGLGRALLALARFRCPGGLELDTPAENFAAREFYRHRGFVAQKVAFDPVVERLIIRYHCPASEPMSTPSAAKRSDPCV